LEERKKERKKEREIREGSLGQMKRETRLTVGRFSRQELDVDRNESRLDLDRAFPSRTILSEETELLGTGDRLLEEESGVERDLRDDILLLRFVVLVQSKRNPGEVELSDEALSNSVPGSMSTSRPLSSEL